MARKNANGEGNIRQRPDGTWEARVSLLDGKRKSIYGKTRKEVHEKLTGIIADRDRGMPIQTDERQTVGEWLTSWLEQIRPTLKPRTLVRYEGEVRNHLIPAFGALRLTKLTPQHLQRLYGDLLSRDYAPASVAHLHAVIHKALEAAVRFDLVPRNVADRVSAPSARTRREMATLTATQVKTLFTTARGERLEALYVLAVTTGMRLGELLALAWSEVDLDGGTLRVTHSIHHGREGAWQLTSPKTAKGHREILLLPEAVAALRAHRARQLEERLAAGQDWHEHGFVFTRRDGEPIRGTHVLEHYFRPLLKRAGLPPIRFHDLRHTAATLMLSESTNPLVVSQVLGHADIAITLGVYGHVTSDMQRSAATNLRRALFGKHAGTSTNQANQS